MQGVAVVKSEPPDVAIVIPTLNITRAAEAATVARKHAGVPCAVIIMWDHVRRGGIKPANAGFQAALDLGAPFICYLNDDCKMAQKDWLKRMVAVLNSNKNFGIAAPGGHCRSNPQRRAKPGMKAGYFVVQSPLAWFCAVIKRKVFLDIGGGFDRDLIHYAGDSLFSAHAHKKGWKSVWVRDVYAEHHPTKKIADWDHHDRKIFLERHPK